MDIFANITVNITATHVAWYGALLATLTAFKVVYDLWSDRGRIKIEWQYNMRMTDSDDSYFVVTVINKGRRPCKITHVAYKIVGRKEIALLTDSFYNENLRVLTEEQPSTAYRMEQGELTESKLWFVTVMDARGKEYRSYNPVTTKLWQRAYWHIIKPKHNSIFKR